MEILYSHHFGHYTQLLLEHIDWRRFSKISNIPGSLLMFYTYQSLNIDTETTSGATPLCLFLVLSNVNLNIPNGSQILKREYCGQALSMLGSALVRVFLLKRRLYADNILWGRMPRG